MTVTSDEAIVEGFIGEAEPLTVMTIEEAAARISIQEGRRVSVQEVRRIERLALLKLRRLMVERGLTLDKLLPG